MYLINAIIKRGSPADGNALFLINESSWFSGGYFSVHATIIYVLPVL